MNEATKRKAILTLSTILFCAIVAGWITWEWRFGNQPSNILDDNYISQMIHKQTEESQNEFTNNLSNITSPDSAQQKDPIQLFLENKATALSTSTASSTATTTNQ